MEIPAKSGSRIRDPEIQRGIPESAEATAATIGGTAKTPPFAGIHSTAAGKPNFQTSLCPILPTMNVNDVLF